MSYCSALGGGGWGEEQLLEMFALLLAVGVRRDVTHPSASEASGYVTSENTHVLLSKQGCTTGECCLEICHQ